MASSSDRTRDARSEAEEGSGAPRLVRALRRQVRKPLPPRDVSFDHDDYRGRNVLSITLRDADDVTEIPIYYEQPVFTRYPRLGATSEDPAHP